MVSETGRHGRSDRTRVATQRLYQELIDAGAATVVGAGRYERSLERLHGASTKKVDDLVKALGANSGDAARRHTFGGTCPCCRPLRPSCSA
jgi:hypothetical protein